MILNYSPGKRLEKYTQNRPQEVLIVTAEIDQELDEITIFKGFSSSLTRPTSFDPEVPILPEDGKIIKIDRIKSPLNPEHPDYIDQGLTWETIQPLLDAAGV
jgi:hypothetical protein